MQAASLDEIRESISFAVNNRHCGVESAESYLIDAVAGLTEIVQSLVIVVEEQGEYINELNRWRYYDAED